MDLTFKIPYYPSLMDCNIREKLYRKKEFYDIYNRLKEYKLNPVTFGRTDLYRDFVCQFLAPETPYDRCLILHSVGTGKTGCAIRIAEQYKSTFRRAVILNKSDTSTHNFEVLLSKYFERIGMKNYQKDFYVLDTYNKFAKKILRTAPSKLAEEYECTVFILDEVHNIITSSYDTSDAVYTTLMGLFDALDSCVVVGMTATPMRDQYTEIIPLLNMFVKNPQNKIPEIPQSFEDIEARLVQVVKSCVSWYTEQFTFETHDIGHKLFNLHMSVVPLQMGTNQLLAYTQVGIASDVVNTQMSVNFMDKDKTYVSLGAFESEGANIRESVIQVSELYGKRRMITYQIAGPASDILENPHSISCKFAYTMEHIESDKYYYTDSDKPKPLDWPSHKHLCDGLIYIFCEDIANTGIKTIIALFRLFGYEYYLGGSINNIEANPMRFTTYVGDKSICPNGKERLALFCDPRNLDGKYCKIIIASNVMRESVSLKGIRKVFVWTPHWNYSSIVQAQGRAIRKDAFIDIVDLSHHNVKIHRLVAVTTFAQLQHVIDLYNNECDEQLLCREMRSMSIDLYKYYRSSIKQSEMNKVEDILSTMSLDNYVITNPHKMPNFSDSLDMSTIVQYNNSTADAIKSELHALLKDGPKHLMFVTEQLSNIQNLCIGEMDVLKYIDALLNDNKAIRDKLMVPHFIHICNDVLYLSTNAVERGYCIPLGPKDKYVKSIDAYIDRSDYKFTDFNWDLDKRTVADNIDDIYPYIVDICERAVSEKHDNIINMFQRNIHCIMGEYFHILERSRYTSTKYSNTSKSVQNTVLIKHYNKALGKWLFVDDQARHNIGTRIDLINRFRSLELIIRHSVYGSISTTDGQFRIHNYVTTHIHDTSARIYVCRLLVNMLLSEPHLNYASIAQYERSYRQSILVLNTTDRRNDMRGRNIDTFGRVQIATTELLLLVKAFQLNLDVPATVFYHGNAIMTSSLDINTVWSMLDYNPTVQVLMDQYPYAARLILIKYYQLISTGDVNRSKNTVCSLILDNNLYVFD